MGFVSRREDDGSGGLYHDGDDAAGSTGGEERERFREGDGAAGGGLRLRSPAASHNASVRQGSASSSPSIAVAAAFSQWASAHSISEREVPAADFTVAMALESGASSADDERAMHAPTLADPFVESGADEALDDDDVIESSAHQRPEASTERV